MPPNQASASSERQDQDPIDDTSNSEIENLDEDQLLHLARSIPSQTVGLAPEPQENAALGPLYATPQDGRTRSGNAWSSGSDPDQEDAPGETSPLLRHGHRHSSDNQRESGENGNENNDDNIAPAAQTTAKFLIETSPGRFWLVFGIILVNLFISAFDGTIMASSHPVITSHFHAANSASWLSTSYLLTTTAFQPLLGRLSDAVGRKPIFVVCNIVFFSLDALVCNGGEH